MVQFTKESLIREVLMEAPESAPLFQAIGMHCLGCAMASSENLEEACMVHGVNPDLFVEKLNEFIVNAASVK